MSARKIRAGSTSIMDEIVLLDSTAFTPEIVGGGVTIANLDIQYHREGAAAAATKLDATGSTLGTFTSAGIAEVGATDMPGVFELGVPDAALAVGSRYVTLSVTDTGLAPAHLKYELDHGPYNGFIHYDDNNGTAGSTPDIHGTEWFPTTTAANVTALRAFFPGFGIACKANSDYTLEAAYANILLIGEAGASMNLGTSRSVAGSTFSGFEVVGGTGATGAGYVFKDCLFSTALTLPTGAGRVEGEFGNTITVGGAVDMDIVCTETTAGSTAILSVNGTGLTYSANEHQLTVESGDLQLNDMTDGQLTVNVTLKGGALTIHTDADAGTINVNGPGHLEDNSQVGCTVNDNRSTGDSNVLTTQMTESYAADGVAPTAAQALFLIQQALTEFDIVTTAKTVRKLDGTTQAAILTLNDATTPTSLNRTA